SVFLPIPHHRFFLQDYNTLYPCLNNVDILTDVIGRISVVQTLESKQINKRIAYKCDVRIENIRKEEVMVTLWGDIGEAFSSLSMDAFSLPVVVVFTSLKAEFLHIAKTIDELAFLDLDLHKDDTFLCKASIKCFDTRFDGWYSACPHCVKQMHKDLTSGQLICQNHPNQIPTLWYKVNLILEDETNEMSALIITSNSAAFVKRNHSVLPFHVEFYINIGFEFSDDNPTIPATPTIEDKALDALAIEDKKRQYAAAENYLEDVHSALATSEIQDNCRST
ncbi:hypothetical protein DVH24_007878, partial [Malus domestica]